MPKTKILVIEDDREHRLDAMDFFESLLDVEVVYAKNYREAESVMLDYDREKGGRVKGDIDGVISDIYSPLTSNPHWNQPEPIGVRVAIELTQVGLPFVLNTAGYHHGRKYEWIHQFAGSQRWTLVDNCGDYEQESDSKNWKRAYEALEKKLMKENKNVKNC